jgi:hypothetical protein
MGEVCLRFRRQTSSHSMPFPENKRIEEDEGGRWSKPRVLDPPGI